MLAAVLFLMFRKLNETEQALDQLTSDLNYFLLLKQKNYMNLQSNLQEIEDECKIFLGLVNLSKNYKEETREIFLSFLTSRAHHILSMKRYNNHIEA